MLDKFYLTIIIGGEEIVVETDQNGYFDDPVGRALFIHGSLAGRGIEKLEIRDADGFLLERGRTIKDSGIKNLQRLFIWAPVGSGG